MFALVVAACFLDDVHNYNIVGVGESILLYPDLDFDTLVAVALLAILMFSRGCVSSKGNSICYYFSAVGDALG